MDNNKKRDKKFLVISIAIIIIILVFSYYISNNFTASAQAVPDGELDEVSSNSVVGMVINEVMSSNGGVISDENGQLYDWIELYNGTDNDINLKNYGLSDTKNSIKWVFSDQIIEAKGYLIVFLSGDNRSGLYANFKLRNEGGEVLSIRNPSGEIIDKIDLPALDKNEVLARNSENEWTKYTTATPGYENSLKGQQEFQDSIMKLDNTLAITEVLPKNEGHFKDSYGEYSGYIEITNISDKSINLNNYSLSNNINVPFQWQFDDVILMPNECIVVYTSNKDEAISEIHANFKLSYQNGTAVLTNSKGKIIDKVDYENLANGYAVMKEEDKYVYSSVISPGYSNSSEGTEEFSKNYLANPNSLMINEVMNSNYSYMAQNGGQYYDWIELKNNSNDTIRLSDYYISTTTNNAQMYQLPDIILEPDQYFILMASGDTSLSNKSYYHTNFKISDRESLYLYEKNDIVDSVFIAEIPTGYSFGRGSKNGFFYMENPTPKAENKSGVYQFSYEPTVNVAAGIYNDVTNIKVKISSVGNIYYTLDGSTPTTSSKKYSKPITLKKTTVLKYIAKEDGKPSSSIGISSYIINENHTIPVMSVSLPPSSFSSVQSRPWTEGYEVAAYAELFELDGSGFEIPCGFKLFGGSTRGHAKKSFTLNFRKKYGEGTLNYQIFENRDFSSFNSLVLRTASQDSNSAVIRDILMTSLVDEYTDVDVQAYRPIILYVNGDYRGIYFIRERVDETFISNHYNVDGTKSDLLRIDGEVKVGDRTAYNQLLAYIRKNDLSIAENYEYVKEKIDINNLIDYWIAETYITNNDIVNCRFFSNPYVDNGKWKFVFYDLDYAMYNPDTNYYYFSTNSDGMTQSEYSTELLRNLMKNKEFRKTYVERLSYNLKNTWDQDTILAKIDEIYNEIKAEMPRNQSRWNLSMSAWNAGIADLKYFVKTREKYLLSQTQAWFNLSDKEMEKYFGD